MHSEALICLAAMFVFLAAIQCILSLLIILSVVLQKGARDSLGGLKSNPSMMPEETNRFLLRVTTALVALFFINSILLAKVSCQSTTRIAARIIERLC